MKCEYCDLIEREKEVIYRDEEVLAVVKDMVLTPGQITVISRKHHTILEVVPDETIKKCFSLANKVSVAVFELLEAQGTNILIQNGLGAGQKVPHFAIEVIPRREGDGINLQWEHKQLMEDEMEMLQSQLREEIKKKDLKDKIEDKNSKKEEAVKTEKTEKKVEKDESKKGKHKKEDYLVKSLRRIP